MSYKGLARSYKGLEVLKRGYKRLQGFTRV